MKMVGSLSGSVFIVVLYYLYGYEIGGQYSLNYSVSIVISYLSDLSYPRRFLRENASSARAHDTKINIIEYFTLCILIATFMSYVLAHLMPLLNFQFILGMSLLLVAGRLLSEILISMQKPNRSLIFDVILRNFALLAFVLILKIQEKTILDHIPLLLIVLTIFTIFMIILQKNLKITFNIFEYLISFKKQILLYLFTLKNIVSQNIDIIILSVFLPLEQLGIYKICMLFTSQILIFQQANNLKFLPKFSKMKSESAKKAYVEATDANVKHSLIITPLCILLGSLYIDYSSSIFILDYFPLLALLSLLMLLNVSIGPIHGFAQMQYRDHDIFWCGIWGLILQSTILMSLTNYVGVYAAVIAGIIPHFAIKKWLKSRIYV